MKEIRRRTMYSLEEGMACGPFALAAIDAEIEVDDNGKTVYLHGEWIDEVGKISYAASTESIYDLVEQMNAGSADEDALVQKINMLWENKIQEDEKYSPYYEELKKMIVDKAHSEGIEYFFEDDDDEELEEDD